MAKLVQTWLACNKLIHLAPNRRQRLAANVMLHAIRHLKPRLAVQRVAAIACAAFGAVCARSWRCHVEPAWRQSLVDADFWYSSMRHSPVSLIWR